MTYDKTEYNITRAFLSQVSLRGSGKISYIENFDFSYWKADTTTGGFTSFTIFNQIICQFMSFNYYPQT